MQEASLNFSLVDTQSIEQFYNSVYDLLLECLRDEDGVHAETIISCIGGLIGEELLRAGTSINFDTQETTPGTRFIANTVNDFLFEENNIFLLYQEISEAFSIDIKAAGDPKKLLKYISSEDAEWGYVPIKIPKKHKPLTSPLLFNAKVRHAIENLCQECRVHDFSSKIYGLIVTSLFILNDTKNVLTTPMAFNILFSTIIGVSKLFPLGNEEYASLVDEANSEEQ
jgi:hypothetical protein